MPSADLRSLTRKPDRKDLRTRPALPPPEPRPHPKTCESIARELRSVQGTCDRNTSNSLRARETSEEATAPRVDSASLAAKHSRVRADIGPPMYTPSFHADSAAFTVAPASALPRPSSENQLVADSVETVHAKVVRVLSSSNRKRRAARVTAAAAPMPEAADSTTATSATVSRGAVTADPTSAGAAHARHFEIIGGTIILDRTRPDGTEPD